MCRTVPAMPTGGWDAPASRVQDSNLLLPFTKRLLFRDELSRRVRRAEDSNLQGGRPPPVFETGAEPVRRALQWVGGEGFEPSKPEAPGLRPGPVVRLGILPKWFQPGSNRRLRVESAGSFR